VLVVLVVEVVVGGSVVVVVVVEVVVAGVKGPQLVKYNSPSTVPGDGGPSQ
jgi:hypothetical protein